MEKKDAAIQEEDVAQDQAVEQEAEGLDEKPRLQRDAAMEEMVAKRREQAKREAQESAREFGEADTEEPGEDDTPDGEPAGQTDTDPEMVDLKVDGKIIRKPKAEVEAEGGVAEVQKRIAVETRMAQAAEERRRLEQLQYQQAQRERDLQRKEQELNAKMQEMQALANDPKSDVTDDDVAIAQQFVDGFYSGDEEQATEVFAKILKQMRQPQATKNQPQVDPDQIAEQVQERLTYRNSLSEGKQTFEEKYAHLKQDPQLFRMTDEATARLMQQHPDWEPKKVILEAAKEVDSWVKRFAGNTTDDNPAGQQNLVSEQQQRKRNMDRVPSATTRKPTQPSYKPKTRQEIFEQMRKNRAQG
jgi:hypothetical protein